MSLPVLKFHKPNKNGSNYADFLFEDVIQENVVPNKCEDTFKPFQSAFHCTFYQTSFWKYCHGFYTFECKMYKTYLK